MTLLQVLWLLVAWLTGAVTHSSRILPLVIYTLLCGALMFFVPPYLKPFIQSLEGRISASNRSLAITLVALVLIPGVLYALYQPFVRVDEQFSLAAARLLAHEGPSAFFANYAQIPWLGPQHPPLLTLLNGLAVWLPGPDLLFSRFVGLGFAAGTLWLTYLLGRDLYGPVRGARASLLLFSFPLFLRMGASAHNDVPVTFFFILTLYLVLRLSQKPTRAISLLAGLAIGLGLLTKYTMLLIFPVLLGWWVLDAALRQRHLLPYLLLMVFCSLAVVSPWLLYAWRTDILAFQFGRLSGYSGFVTTTGAGKRYLIEVLFAKLPVDLGVYAFPLLLLGGQRLFRRWAWPERLLVWWIVVVLMVVGLTVPNHRYFLPAFPALALVVASALDRVPHWVSRILVLALMFCAGSLYLFPYLQRLSTLLR